MYGNVASIVVDIAAIRERHGAPKLEKETKKIKTGTEAKEKRKREREMVMFCDANERGKQRRLSGRQKNGNIFKLKNI